jgi:hypothetical protein
MAVRSSTPTIDVVTFSALAELPSRLYLGRKYNIPLRTSLVFHATDLILERTIYKIVIYIYERYILKRPAKGTDISRSFLACLTFTTRLLTSTTAVYVASQLKDPVPKSTAALLNLSGWLTSRLLLSCYICIHPQE